MRSTIIARAAAICIGAISRISKAAHFAVLAALSALATFFTRLLPIITALSLHPRGQCRFALFRRHAVLCTDHDFNTNLW